MSSPEDPYWDTQKMADRILPILRDEALAGQLRAEAPRPTSGTFLFVAPKAGS